MSAPEASAARSRSGARVARGVVALVLVATAVAAEAQGLFEGFRRSVRGHAAFNRGKALYEAREYRAASERFTEALTLDPDHDEARALLAWSQHFLGEYRAAIITFKTAIRRQPAWEGLYDGLGWSRFRLGRYHLASDAFRVALDRSPGYLDALIGLGSAQFELSRYDVALPTLEAALGQLESRGNDGQADLPDVRAKVAWCLYYLGRYPDAVATFEKAIRATPDWHGLHNGAGWCYLKLGQKARARAAFERALALQPGYEDALEGLRQTRS